MNDFSTANVYQNVHIKDISTLPEGSLVIITGMVFSLTIKEKALIFKGSSKS